MILEFHVTTLTPSKFQKQFQHKGKNTIPIHSEQSLAKYTIQVNLYMEKLIYNTKITEL